MLDLGVVRPGATLRIPFSSFDKDDGSSITMTNFAVTDILIYKDGGTTERASTSGFTATTDFDGKTGKHLLIIDLSDDTTADFFKAGSEYLIAIDAVTIDTVTTGGWVARFTIGYRGAYLNTSIATLASQTSFTLTDGPAEDDALNGMWCIIHDKASAVQTTWAIILDYTGSTKTVTLAATPPVTFTIAAVDNIAIMGPMPLQPTVTGRALDVSTGGEAGVDWANVGSPTTTLNLSGTTIKTATDVEADTAEIGAAGAGLTNINLPNQTMDIVGNITGNLSGSVGSVTGAVGSVTGTVGGIAGTTTTLDALQTALNSAHGSGSWATATGFSTHSAADVWSVATRVLTAGTNIALVKGTGVTGFNDLSAADVRGAVGLASANLDTQIGTLATAANLATVAGYLDTEIAAILLITNKLDTTLQEEGTSNVWQFTTAALELAPTGAGTGSSDCPTVQEIRTEMDANSTKLANLDATVSSRLSTAGYTAPDNSGISTAASAATTGSASAADIKLLVEADLYIDTGVVPWALVYIQRGTGGIGVGTELLRKRLKNVSGVDLISTSTVVGQSIQ